MIGLTGLIAAGGLISSIIFGFQLHEMQAAGHLTQESIRISEESLKISRETYVAGQRPWISIQISILGPLIFDSNGAEIKIGVTLKNHGHSPAMKVRDSSFLIRQYPTGKEMRFASYSVSSQDQISLALCSQTIRFLKLSPLMPTPMKSRLRRFEMEQ
jgi:hypothetical protein